MAIEKSLIVLGLTEPVRREAIRKAYLQRTKVIHPDRFSPQSSEWLVANEMLSELNSAYAECLETASSRQDDWCPIPPVCEEQVAPDTSRTATPRKNFTGTGQS